MTDWSNVSFQFTYLHFLKFNFSYPSQIPPYLLMYIFLPILVSFSCRFRALNFSRPFTTDFF
jgi:hypothetical protein